MIREIIVQVKVEAAEIRQAMCLRMDREKMCSRCVC